MSGAASTTDLTVAARLPSIRRLECFAAASLDHDRPLAEPRLDLFELSHLVSLFFRSEISALERPWHATLPSDERCKTRHPRRPRRSHRDRMGAPFVLRFISGKYQGGEFPIVPDKQIIVGRSSDLDMVLVEDMVSRKHARIAMQSDQIWIEDLGSTNGTFVNGEKIKRARLKEGDRVLIGTSILKVIAGDAPRDAHGREARARERGRTRGAPASSAR